MGFFTPPPGPLDPALQPLVSRSDLHKIVAREQFALLDALLEGETVNYLCRSESKQPFVVNRNAAVAVTDLRLLIVHRGRVEVLSRSDITWAGVEFNNDARMYRCGVLAGALRRAHQFDFWDRLDAVVFIAMLGYAQLD